MGYSTLAYAVDLERLNAAAGSGDQALLAKIEESEGEHLESTLGVDGAPTLREAVHAIVTAGKKDKRWAWQYAYALEVLCRALGERLENDDLIAFVTDLDLETRLNDTRLPLGLPEPSDFPVVSYLTADEVRTEYDRFKDEDVTVGDDEELDEARVEFVGYLRQAAERGQAIVMFAY